MLGRVPLELEDFKIDPMENLEDPPGKTIELASVLEELSERDKIDSWSRVDRPIEKLEDPLGKKPVRS